MLWVGEREKEKVANQVFITNIYFALVYIEWSWNCEGLMQTKKWTQGEEEEEKQWCE